MKSAIAGGQLLPGGDGLWVTINTGQTTVVVQAREQGTAMATTAKRTVHIKAFALAEPHIQHLFQHDRLVCVLRVFGRHQNDSSCTLSGNAAGSRVPSTSDQLSSFQISKRCI